MKINSILEIIAFLFIVLFLYTGISKLLDYTVFREQIAMSSFLTPVSSEIAWGLPIIEILVALLLFIPGLRLVGFYASLALMVLFTGYIILIPNFNDKLPCSCGGIIQLLSWKNHLFLNIGLLVLAFVGLYLKRRLVAS